MPSPEGSLSAYVLTHNSEDLIEQVLAPVLTVADEVLVLDSGSSDRTVDIARAMGCRVEIRPFESFSKQRQIAQDLCRYDHVLFVDSDEIMDDTLVASVRKLKEEGFPDRAYCFRRDWHVMGRKVHAVYPVASPDFPVRLIDRRQCNFLQSRPVHESPSNAEAATIVGGTLLHFTFPTLAAFERKLDLYSGLHATVISGARHHVPSRAIVAVRAAVAFFKWYVLKRGFLDGSIGLHCARYAARYTWRKYRLARLQSKQERPSTPQTGA